MDPNCSAARSEKIEAKETELLTSSLKQAETILEGDKVLALKLYDHLKNQGKLSKNEVETLIQEKAAWTLFILERLLAKRRRFS